MHLEILSDCVRHMILLLVYAHDVVDLWQNQSKLVHLVLKVPEDTGLVLHLYESSILCDFEFLLQKLGEPLSDLLNLKHERLVDLDGHKVDVGSDLSDRLILLLVIDLIGVVHR